MPMRPFALSALLLLAAVGCGVPDNTAVIARAEKEAADEGKPKEAAKTPEAKPDPKKPTDPKEVKPVEEDPAKLGLVIVDTKPGTGKAAELGDTCYMLYTGRLKDKGTVFDSTSKRNNEPFTFPLGAGQVIKGWDLGIKGMKEGGKRTLTIPAALAYGAEAKGDDIPANSDLVFDIELLAVLKPEDANVVERTIVVPGTGPAAKKGDVVSIKYKGTLLNGTMFDDNGGKPVQFTIGDGTVIGGFDVAVVGMKKGAVANVTVPPSLGIQATGPGGKVPPNSIVKFEITLVSIG